MDGFFDELFDLDGDGAAGALEMALADELLFGGGEETPEVENGRPARTAPRVNIRPTPKSAAKPTPPLPSAEAVRRAFPRKTKR